MKAIHRVYMDLAKQWKEPLIHVVQNDKYSRRIAFELKCDGKPWMLPRDAAVIIRYRKKGNHVGEYDTLPDGTPAYWINRNVITIELAPQVLTDAGYVHLSATVLQGSSQLHTFQIILDIAEKLVTGVDSTDYLNITNFLPQPASASVGQYLEVKEVDEAGNITQLKAVEPPEIPEPEPVEIPENIVTCNLESSTEDESAVPINADTLGGELPGAYIKHGEMATLRLTAEVDGEQTILASRSGGIVFAKIYRYINQTMSANGSAELAELPEGYRPSAATAHPTFGVTNSGSIVHGLTIEVNTGGIVRVLNRSSSSVTFRSLITTFCYTTVDPFPVGEVSE